MTALLGVAAFKGMDPAELDRIEASSRVLELRDGARIFADGDAAVHVPAYAVWDLTGEWRIPNTPVRVIGGVNNVFDEDYYSRIRPDGIDPAPRRNYYLGAALEF